MSGCLATIWTNKKKKKKKNRFFKEIKLILMNIFCECVHTYVYVNFNYCFFFVFIFPLFYFIREHLVTCHVVRENLTQLLPGKMNGQPTNHE